MPIVKPEMFHQGSPIRWIRPSPPLLAWLWLRRHLFRSEFQLLPPTPKGLRLHVGAGQTMLEGYENLDAYGNADRPDFFQTPITESARAETLDLRYDPESVAEIRCHHVFEHVSLLDVDRTLQGWNRIMKPGGLLWIEVPDFEWCARQVLRRRREENKEIFWRAIFGSQVGPGEFHRNGFTARRLIKLLEDYGFEVRFAYVRLNRRIPRKPDMFYPSNSPLPDLTVKAVKIGPPKREVIDADWTHIAYRRLYPDPALAVVSPMFREKGDS